MNKRKAMTKSLEERFFDKIMPEPMSGCWLWTATCNQDGYGMIRDGGTMKNAHRVSWELHNGKIPKGHGHHGTCVLHKCDTRSCVNPDHLFLGSNADNVADKVAKGRAAHLNGELHGKSKLTNDDVLKIWMMYKNDGISQRKIARQFGISQALVSNIACRRTWTHINV